ncbi:hypothetical protein FLW53_23135 [Microbispora sp. SCL1-1]|uniref:hypothetical protein n=1 Tax=unclassified Microbispora TaxID=2614687 RepID=UPI001157EADB|nr:MULTISPECIES: hypothetical protein [unclassified Microbispora]NJP27037.1 hypothetical protein [Microbispora sp. CL1-1]TQS11677.1 hypothetical protein FLW53_23135 [Microbispora sp. SCL1-1]
MILRPATDVTDLVREILGDPLAEIAEQHVEPIHLASGAVSTAWLHRVRGTTTSGVRWSFFVKSIHSIEHSARLENMPEQMRAVLSARFPWRADADVHLARHPLPDGLRLPRMYRLGDDRLVMWLEDVPVAPATWDLHRYRAAARLLGGASRRDQWEGAVSGASRRAGRDVRWRRRRSRGSAVPCRGR